MVGHARLARYPASPRRPTRTPPGSSRAVARLAGCLLAPCPRPRPGPPGGDGRPGDLADATGRLGRGRRSPRSRLDRSARPPPRGRRPEPGGGRRLGRGTHRPSSRGPGTRPPCAALRTGHRADAAPARSGQPPRPPGLDPRGRAFFWAVHPTGAGPLPAPGHRGRGRDRDPAGARDPRVSTRRVRLDGRAPPPRSRRADRARARLPDQAPVHTRSVGRAARYARWLDPALGGLQDRSTGSGSARRSVSRVIAQR